MSSDDRGRALVRGLGMVATIALVVGNMVGTSIYTLPASLAKATGPLAIVAWLVTAAGYLLIAVVYASLGSRYPRTGGPYVFAREAFGDFAGFQTVWAYWFSAIIGNAAIVTSVVGYATGLSATLRESVPFQFALANAVIWGLCALNVVGIRHGGRLQTVVVVLNVVPLLVLCAAAFGSIEATHFEPLAPRGWGSLAAGAALVVWAYSGVESATVASEEVTSPERTIRKGTLIGYAIATVVFLMSSVAVIGVLPSAAIESSPRPVALAMERALGPIAGTIVSITAILAGIGTLNGWTIMASRIPLSASRDGLFFRGLARLHPTRGTPWVALVVGSAVSSLMLLLYFYRPLLRVFDFIVLLSVLTTLLPHLYSMAAELMLARREPGKYTLGERRRAHVVAPLAFAFVLYTIYGVGAEVALWGLLVVLLGMPLYVLFATSSQARMGSPSKRDDGRGD